MPLFYKKKIPPQQGMELKQFIKTAVNDITEALSELQKENKTGALIVPDLVPGDPDKCFDYNGTVYEIERVLFDIEISASSGALLAGNASVGLTYSNLGIKAGTSASAGNNSRISFSVPLVYPRIDVKRALDEIDTDSNPRR